MTEPRHARQPAPRSLGLRRASLPLGLGLLLLLAAVAQAQEPAAETFDERAASRYRQMLERNPEAGTLYRRLLEMYGRKDGVAELLADYQARVEREPKAFGPRMLLGHLLRTSGRDEEALAAYATAATLEPGSPLPHEASAAIAEAGQDLAAAYAHYDAALQRSTRQEDKERLLKHTAELALRNQDLAEAGRRLDQLQRLAPGDAHLGGEVAALYESNGYLEEALQRWQSLLQALRGNPVETVRALKDVARLQLTLGRDREAEDSLRRALALVGPGNWNLPDLRSQLIEVYRRRDALRDLVAEFERSLGQGDLRDRMMLAGLYEELGDDSEAIRVYRAAAQRQPKEAEPHRKLIDLYERAGRGAEAVAEYQALIRAQPRNHQPVLELAELHQRRGEASRAKAVLDGLARRSSRDPEVLLAVADRYLRFGLRDQALALSRRLQALEPDNETHLVHLGEQLYLMGQAEQAAKVWRRIREVVPDPAQGWSVYGETLAGHDRVDEAVEALQKAVALAPDDPSYRKTLAGILRRAERLGEARDQWRELLSRARTRRQRQEAREELVALAQELSELDADMEDWQEAWERQPDDPDAGHLLGLGAMRRKDYALAEKVWLALLQRDPGDVEALLALETVYARQVRPADAMAVLERLAPLLPHRARELYQRMANYALQLQRDEDAVRWASRAVALNPDDAAAHARLGEIQYGRQDLPRAVAAYRRAVHLAPKETKHAFKLAQILQDLGRSADADEVYRRLLRDGSDEGDLRRAAQRSLRLNTLRGTLPSLERELLPLLFRSPPRPVYVQILVDLYEQMVGPLRRALRFGSPEEARHADQQLRELGRRASKPLLEAVRSDDRRLMGQALGLLTLLAHADAAQPLAHLLDDREVPLRVQTALALGRSGAPAAAVSLGRALGDSEREVRESAAWALGRIDTPAARRLLLQLLERREPRGSVRAMALVALARSGAPEALPWLRRGLGDAELLGRAAAAWGCGRFPKHAELVPLLTESLRRDSELVRALAAQSLAAFPQPSARAALFEALWSGEAKARARALEALRHPGPSALPLALESGLDFYDPDGAQVRTQAFLEALLLAPAPPLAAGPLAWEPASLQAAAQRALTGEAPLREACLADLDAAPEGLALGALPLAPDAAEQARLRAALAPLAPRLAELAASGSGAQRGAALSLLAKLGDPGAVALARQALSEADPSLRAAGLAALARARPEGARAELERLAGDDRDWEVRSQALRSLARWTGEPPSPALWRGCQDPAAGARLAAASALTTLGEAGARPSPEASAAALLSLLQDPLPQLRAQAALAAGALGLAQASAALQALEADPWPQARAAARQALARLR